MAQTADGRPGRRERVLRAAMEAIVSQGAARVRITEIARRAGMSPGHILYYFGSKDRILLETLVWSETSYAELRHRELPRIPSAVDRLIRFIEIAAPTGRADPNWSLWFHVWALSENDAEVKRRAAEIDRAWIRDCEDIVRAGLESGEFSSVKPHAFAVAFMALVDGLSIAVLKGATGITRTSMIQIAVAMAARELGFEAPAVPSGARPTPAQA